MSGDPPARRRGRMVARGLGFAALLGVAVLAVEVQLARTREYLPNPRYEVDTTVAPRGLVAAEQPLELLFLGDSTVAGVGAETLEESLAVQVAQRVADALGRAVHVVGYGVSGARTDDVRLEQVPDAINAVAPDVVVVVIGSNDVIHLTPPWSMAGRTTRMLRAVQAFDAPIVLGGIPLFETVGALDQPLRAIVSAYAGPLRAAQEAAAAEVEGVRYVPIAREASPRFLGRPRAMSSDGYHPSEVGYGFWADALAPAVVDVLDADAVRTASG